jgi:hypothetical protein
MITMNNKVKWIVKSGMTATECTSFPFAFRHAFNIVRKALDKNENIEATIRGIQIVGPPNGKGEPMTYNYSNAAILAKSMGLLLLDGSINQKEFKKR